jgi:hypothetical protein
MAEKEYEIRCAKCGVLKTGIEDKAKAQRLALLHSRFLPGDHMFTFAYPEGEFDPNRIY